MPKTRAPECPVPAGTNGHPVQNIGLVLQRLSAIRVKYDAGGEKAIDAQDYGFLVDVHYAANGPEELMSIPALRLLNQAIVIRQFVCMWFKNIYNLEHDLIPYVMLGLWQKYPPKYAHKAICGKLTRHLAPCDVFKANHL